MNKHPLRLVINKETKFNSKGESILLLVDKDPVVGPAETPSVHGSREEK